MNRIVCISLLLLAYSLCSCSDILSHSNQNYPAIELLQGEWEMTVTSWSSPIADPRTTHGKSKQALLPNSSFLIERNSSSEISPSVHDTALFGYDPDKEVLIALWKDPFTRRIGLSEGKFDREENIFTLIGISIDPSTKMQSPSLVQARLIGNDKRLISVFEKSSSGDLFKTLEILYYR